MFDISPKQLHFGSAAGGAAGKTGAVVRSFRSLESQEGGKPGSGLRLREQDPFSAHYLVATCGSGIHGARKILPQQRKGTAEP